MNSQKIQLDVFTDVFAAQQAPQHFVYLLDFKLCFPPRVVNKRPGSHSLSLVQAPN